MGYYQAHPKDLKSNQFGPWSVTPSVHRFIKQFFFSLFFISPFTPSSPFSLISISRLCLTLPQLSSSRWGLCSASESLKILFPSHGYDLLDCFWVFFFLPLSRSRPLCFSGFINHQVLNLSSFFLCLWFLSTWFCISEIWVFFFLSLVRPLCFFPLLLIDSVGDQFF